MPWARIDDDLYDHRKFMRLSNDAVALWVVALSYANKKLTDGHLTFGEVERLRGLRSVSPEAIDELASCDPTNPDDHPLWERTNSGYLIHDFLDYNESREEILARRERNADRQANWRQRRKEGSRSNAVTNSVTNRVSPAHVTTAVTDMPGTRYPDPESGDHETSPEKRAYRANDARAEGAHARSSPSVSSPANLAQTGVVDEPTPSSASPLESYWQVFTRTLGYAPKTESERARWKRGIGQLARAQVQPEHIAELVARYRERYGEITCTPGALANNLGILQARLPASDAAPRRSGSRTGRAVELSALNQADPAWEKALAQRQDQIRARRTHGPATVTPETPVAAKQDGAIARGRAVDLHETPRGGAQVDSARPAAPAPLPGMRTSLRGDRDPPAGVPGLRGKAGTPDP